MSETMASFFIKCHQCIAPLGKHNICFSVELFVQRTLAVKVAFALFASRCECPFDVEPGHSIKGRMFDISLVRLGQCCGAMREVLGHEYTIPINDKDAVLKDKGLIEKLVTNPNYKPWTPLIQHVVAVIAQFARWLVLGAIV